jgi:hypothetical protein
MAIPVTAMKLILQRRAEIAMRSLGKREQSQIVAALGVLSSADPRSLGHRPQIRRIRGVIGENLYSYRIGREYSLLFSLQGDTCIIEDVVAHDRLDRLMRAEAQK